MRARSASSTDATLSGIEEWNLEPSHKSHRINNDLFYKDLLNDLKEQSADLDKYRSQQAHVQTILNNIDQLTEPDPIPDNLIKIVNEIIELGPNRCSEERKKRFDHAMELSKATRRQSQIIDGELHENVRAVLRQAGSKGQHLAFLRSILDHYKYDQTDEIVHSLIEGFPLIGEIPVERSASEKVICEPTITPDQLETEAQEITTTAEKSLVTESSRPDQIAVLREIYDQTINDVKLDRIGRPSRIKKYSRTPATRRFGIEQISSKGRTKIRCIDDFLRSKVNGLCGVHGSIRMGKISELTETARRIQEQFPNEQLVIFKTDFKSAYRCCPVNPEHHPWSEFVFWDPELREPRFAIHFAMPFGSIAAVYGWDRLAHAITYLIQNILLVPAIRYVDDLFGVIFAKDLEAFRNMLLDIVTELGFTLEEEKTPIPTATQVILGIEISLKESLSSGERRVHVVAKIDPQKADFWKKQINEIIKRNEITAKEAEKLAGRLNFAACAVAGQSGSARIHELYKRVYGRSFGQKLDHRIKADLMWWLAFLEREQTLKFRILGPPKKRSVLYTDAEGHGGIGAVLITPQARLFFRIKVDQRFASKLIQRATQIIPYEALAVLIALNRFKRELAQNDLVLLIDNTSVLGSVRKGRSSADDVHKIITAISDLCFELNITKHIFWVPSAMNISDGPSRGETIDQYVEVHDLKRSIAASVGVVQI